MNTSRPHATHPRTNGRFATVLLSCLGSYLSAIALADAVSAQDLRPNESIVDHLKHHGLDHSLAARAGHWDRTFPAERGQYRGTAVQNIRLLETFLFDRRGEQPVVGACHLDSAALTAPRPDAQRMGRLDTAQDFAVRIDARSPAERDAEREAAAKVAYHVVFTARAGVPGHAWVLLGIEDHSRPENVVCTGRAFGAYPEAGSKDVVLGRPVPGRLVEGWAANADGAAPGLRLVVRVSEERYRAARRAILAWQEAERYELIASDCVQLSASVARVLGLEVPGRSEALLPASFLKDLIRRNVD